MRSNRGRLQKVVRLRRGERKKIITRHLIRYFGLQVRFCFRLACIPYSAFLAGRSHIFIYTVITLYQFGESQVFKVAVAFRCIYRDKGDKPFYLPAAVRAVGKLITVYPLLHFKPLTLFTPFSKMFIFINGHSLFSLPHFHN